MEEKATTFCASCRSTGKRLMLENIIETCSVCDGDGIEHAIVIKILHSSPRRWRHNIGCGGLARVDYWILSPNSRSYLECDRSVCTHCHSIPQTCLFPFYASVLHVSFLPCAVLFLNSWRGGSECQSVVGYCTRNHCLQWRGTLQLPR